MATPAMNTAIRRPDLSALVIEMMEASGARGYIGTELLPVYTTAMNSGVYPVIPKEALMKNVNPARAPKSAYVRTSYEYERGIYTTHEYGVEEPLDDVERALMNQEAPGAADMLAVKRANDYLARAQELRVAGMLFSASAVTRFGSVTLTNEWDDYANATPITDIKAQLNAFRLKSGKLPEALVINWEVFNNLTQCVQIIEQLKYTFPGLQIQDLNTAQMAQVLNVPRIIIGGGMTDTTGQGVASNIQDIWSNEYAALVNISTGSDLTAGGLGRTFAWSGQGGEGTTVETYREEQVRSDIYRVRQYVGETLLASVDTAGSIVSDIASDNIILFDNVTT